MASRRTSRRSTTGQRASRARRLLRRWAPPGRSGLQLRARCAPPAAAAPKFRRRCRPSEGEGAAWPCRPIGARGRAAPPRRCSPPRLRRTSRAAWLAPSRGLRPKTPLRRRSGQIRGIRRRRTATGHPPRLPSSRRLRRGRPARSGGHRGHERRAPSRQIPWRGCRGRPRECWRRRAATRWRGVRRPAPPPPNHSSTAAPLARQSPPADATR
mmetsp:Transcript_16239/g.48156  ORF Transcript_16239/g.48156 Transcript_16239/m.48156 type:complete len:212 (+) Transcript_16239:1433-2068(+)